MESIGWRVPDVHALTHAVGWKSSHTFKASQDDGTGWHGSLASFTFGMEIMEKHNKSRCESKYFESFGSIKISVYQVFTRTICNDLSSQNLSSCTIGQGVPLLNDLTIGQKTFPIQEFVSFNYNLTLTIKL